MAQLLAAPAETAILKERVSSPSIDESELKNEKEVILDEIRRNKDNPARSAADISWSLVFQEHPYKYPVIGHEELFRRLSKEDLEAYYAERYSPDNMTLVVAGDITKEKVFEEISKEYGTLRRDFITERTAPDELPQLGVRIDVFESR